MIPGSRALLDRRYRVHAILFTSERERRYAGWHAELDLPVRITALRPASAGAAPAATDALRFWTLAQRAAGLRHPVLHRLRDCFRLGDEYFLVEDAVAGETLAARIQRRGCLSLRETLALGLVLCDALAYAAQVSAELLPFATITPETLTLLPSGQVVIDDIGARRWLDLPPTPPEPQAAAYCAPEVTTRGAVDARADVYSVAAVLFYGMTGRAPAYSIADRCPVEGVEQYVPAAVSQVLERALAADPAVRYADAEHLGRALAMAARLALPEVGTLVTQQTRRRTHPQAAVTPGTGAGEAQVPAHAGLDAPPVSFLGRSVHLASEVIRLSLLRALRRTAVGKESLADPALHSGA